MADETEESVPLLPLQVAPLTCDLFNANQVGICVLSVLEQSATNMTQSPVS